MSEEPEAVLTITVRRDSTSVHTVAAKGLEPSFILQGALAALHHEYDSLAGCPVHTRAETPQSIPSEREEIVKWLRGETPTDYTDPQYDIGINLADAIERGEHLTRQALSGAGE